MVIFPEMTLTAFSMNTGDTAEDPATLVSVELCKELAQELQMPFVFGIMFRDSDKAKKCTDGG